MYYRHQNSGTGGVLNQMRLRAGNEKLKVEYRKMIKENRNNAIALINADKLQFATLYVLMPAIAQTNLMENLNYRNRTAFFLCAAVDPSLAAMSAQSGELPEDEPTHAALKWMFLSGYPDSGLSDGFDQTLDAAASLLTQTYHDTEVIPKIVRMIFLRNRKGKYTQDLIWTLFRSRNPQILSILAEHLRSSDKRDVGLAEKLMQNVWDNENTGKKGYTTCMSWIRENSPYLYFTGESFHQSSNPTLYRVNLEAKYLCRRVSTQGEEAVETFNPSGTSQLDSFRHLPNGQKAVLAQYSNRLYANNRRRWNEWIKYPIEKQMKIAESRLGGTQ